MDNEWWSWPPLSTIIYYYYFVVFDGNIHPQSTHGRCASNIFDKTEHLYFRWQRAKNQMWCGHLRMLFCRGNQTHHVDQWPIYEVMICSTTYYHLSSVVDCIVDVKRRLYLSSELYKEQYIHSYHIHGFRNSKWFSIITYLINVFDRVNRNSDVLRLPTTIYQLATKLMGNGRTQKLNNFIFVPMKSLDLCHSILHFIPSSQW